MNIVKSPRLTLIARQTFIYPDHIDWRSDIGRSYIDLDFLVDDRPAEVLAEFAGRLCYLSFGEGELDGHKTVRGRPRNEDYLRNIIEVGHGSVLEHAAFSLLIEGVSRALTHELVRHRAGMAYSQLSQRYVDESEVAFVLPPEIEVGTLAFETWKRSCERSLAEYRELLAQIEAQIDDESSATMRRKRARETARSVLPNATETKIVVTGNVRAWRHFIELRAARGADSEIQRLAVAIFRLLRAQAPSLFQDYAVLRLPDGAEIVVTKETKD